MDFRFSMPTEIFFGTACVVQNGDVFARYGKKALLVTGKHSARVSGALSDVETALGQRKIAWRVFDGVGENPTFAQVEAGAALARQFRPDMVVAIGGGSPLDAAKAIAMLATNEMPAAALFGGGFAKAPLPVLAIPLTAGTGSEVTQYAILTDDAKQTKRGFATPENFPKVAFLDARYTASLPAQVTVHTAVDALSHLLEGYLSRRATALTDALALTGMATLAEVVPALKAGEFSASDREKLLYASLLGGVVIAQTGTTAVHALGYSLTYFRQIPHGQANGLLMGEYLRLNWPACEEKIAALLSVLKLPDVDGFARLMTELIGTGPTLGEEEVGKFAAIAAQAASVAWTARDLTEADLAAWLRASLAVAPAAAVK